MSTPDGRPVAQLEQHRGHHQLQQDQQQRSTVRPYRPINNFRRCHCKCNSNAAKPKYLDLIEERTNKKSKLQQAEKGNAEELSINTAISRRKNKGRTICVITAFIILIAGAIVLFLTWPRTPLFRIDGATLLEPPTISETEHPNTGNVAFESTWSLIATLDNRRNYIPLRFSMEIIVKESGTIIGHQATQQQQQRQNVLLPSQMISQINIPVHIGYEARQASDPTFASLRRACVENTHEALQLQFWITIHISGLEWANYKPRIVATPATGGFLCPT